MKRPVYGNDQNLNNPDVGLVGIFMNLIRQNDIIEVKGSLKRYRDLIHIDDVVEAWFKASLLKKGLNKCINGFVNFTNTFIKKNSEFSL